MSYEKYDLEDFLSDPEFKNWVLRPTESSRLFWSKWIEANPEQKEVIASAREILLSLQFQSAEKISIEEREDILEKLLDKGRNRDSGKANRFRFYYVVAASILLLISTPIYFLVDEENTDRRDTFQPVVQIVKENPRGQKTKIKLPDGSTVWLNSESRLEYLGVFKGKRKVLLEGEAFFEIAENPDMPFEVYTNGVVTTALGTSFNVNTFQRNTVSIGLVSGRISVGMEDQKEKVFANPGEMVVYDVDKRNLNVLNYDNLDFVKWTNRIIVFKRANFNEIKEKLERWYDVTIKVKNVNKNLTFTGEFKNESLESILERMAFVEKFDFKLNGKQVEIIF